MLVFKRKMIIKNITRKTILSSKAYHCKTVFSKAVGLMFAKGPRTLIFKFDVEHKIALHMFFVFFPIDVIFLNKKMKVVDIKENFKPFTFYTSKKKALYAIEFCVGAIRKSRTKIRDKISLR